MDLIGSALHLGPTSVVDLIGSALHLGPTSWQGMASPDDLFNLLVHVGPPCLLSESGCCAHHSLMALMEKLYLTLPEALWHYFAKVLVMLFPSTANYSHIAM